MSARGMSKADKVGEELRCLAAMPDDAIDTSDAPEIQDWSQAERGKFYRPGAEHQIPVYLDAKIQKFLSDRAAAKGVSLSDLANELLKQDMEVVKTVEN